MPRRRKSDLTYVSRNARALRIARQRQKELAAQIGAGSTTGYEAGLTDTVQGTSTVENAVIPQEISANNLSTLPLVSSTNTTPGSSISSVQRPSADSIQDFNTNTIQESGTNTIQESSACQGTSSDNPGSSSVASFIVEDLVRPKKACGTRVSQIQVNFCQPQYRNKGKKNSRSKETQTIPQTQLEGIPIQGRRIVDFDYFFKALQHASNHSKFGCNLNDMAIVNEKKIGISTRYSLKCTQCNFHKVIWTENMAKKRNINTDFVLAMLKINCDFKVINQLLAALRLPSLTHAQFDKECKKMHIETSENINSVITVQKNTSSASDENETLEQVDLGGLLVEDHFEIKQEHVFEKENEPETIIPDETVRLSVDKMVVDEQQLPFDPAVIKQEIDSDVDDDASVDPINSGNKTLNKENLENEQARIMLPQQKETSMCKSEIIVKETHTNVHKTAAIQIGQDNNKPVKLASSEMEITDKESMMNFDNQVIAESRHKKAKIITYEKNIPGSGKLDNPINTQGISTSTAPTKGKSFLEHGSVTNEQQIKAATSTGSITGGNYMYLMPVQNMDSSVGNNSTLIASQMQPNVAAGAYQGMNTAAFMPQTSSTVKPNARGSNSGLLNLSSFVNNFSPPTNSFANNFSTPSNNQLILLPAMMGPTYIPSSAAAAHQPPSLSNVNLNSRAMSISIPSTATTFQQPLGLSNVSVSNSGATSTQPTQPAVPQPSNSADNRPPFNADASRWVGRANMSSNNPSCTLPGGAPKGDSDPVLPRQDSSDTSYHSKRQQFHCDDCNISFTKYESWDSHKKSYCIKRFKLQPSSTITSSMLMNNSSQSTQVNHVNQVTQPHLEELISAMAIKRSFLETSVKTALEAQYVIGLHKSAQNLTQKSFMELDEAMKREKALTPQASFVEQQIAYNVRAQALINAKTAYMQEKHSASAVEEALHRQKNAIEATLTATEHEQAALISTLRSLKVQKNEAPMLETPCNNLSNPEVKSFNHKKLLDTSFVQAAEQQQFAENIFSKSTPSQKTSLAPSAFFTRQKNEIDTNSSSDNILQTASSLDVCSEKINHVDLEENKTVTVNIAPGESLQLKKVNTIASNDLTTSQNCQSLKNSENAFNKLSGYSSQDKETNSSNLYSNSDSPLFQDYHKRQSHDYSHFQNALCLKMAAPHETSLHTPQFKENSTARESSQLQELSDFSMEFFSGNTHASEHQTDKFLIQNIQSEEIDCSDTSK